MLGTFPRPHNEEKRRQKTADYGSVSVDIGRKALRESWTLSLLFLLPQPSLMLNDGTLKKRERSGHLASMRCVPGTVVTSC